MEEKSQSFWIFAVVFSLLIGLVAGWWYGNKTGYDRGLNDAAKASAETPAVKIDTGYKNPFENVNLNPFK